MRTTARILTVERLHGRPASLRAQRVFDWVRRNAQPLLAAAVALGILLMILHWR